MGRRAKSSARVAALMRKDVEELARQPGAVIPGLLMVVVAVLPVLLLIVSSESGELLDPREQSFFFQQFLLLLPMVPVVGSMALAAHAVVGEKQARALEPLLATPLTTAELLAAKSLTPFLFSLALLGLASALYMGGIAWVGAPGVWRSLLTFRTLVLLAGLAPLVSLAGLQTAVILSSRTNDARSAQQLGGLVLMPLTGAFVAQLVGDTVLGVRFTLAAIVVLLLVNAALLWIGVRLFNRETILMRWK